MNYGKSAVNQDKPKIDNKEANQQVEGSGSGSGSGLISSTLAMGIETACRQLLKLDPETEQAFARLNGKVLAIQFSDLGFTLYFLPGGPPANKAPLQVFSYFDGPVDTTLKGSSIAIMAMGLRQNSSDSLFSGEVQVSGDTQLGTRFQQLLQRIDVDWEEHLSRISGDIVAHKVGNLVRGVIQWGRNTVDTLQLDVTEYTQDELRVLPTQRDVQAFVSDVDLMRSDVDRLFVRAQRILTQASKDNLNKPSGADS